MYVTESDLRHQLRPPSFSAVVQVPPNARLSPAAQDFVNAWNLIVDDSADEVPSDGETKRQELVVASQSSQESKRAFSVNAGIRSGSRGHDRRLYSERFRKNALLNAQISSLQSLIMAALLKVDAGKDPESARVLNKLLKYGKFLASALAHDSVIREVQLDVNEVAFGRGLISQKQHAASYSQNVDLSVGFREAPNPELFVFINLAYSKCCEVEITAVEVYLMSHKSSLESICDTLSLMADGLGYLQNRMCQ